MLKCFFNEKTKMPPVDFFKTWSILLKGRLLYKDTLCKQIHKCKHIMQIQPHTCTHFICTQHIHSHVHGHECCILILKHYILYTTTQLSTHYHAYMKHRGWRILKGAIRRVKRSEGKVNSVFIDITNLIILHLTNVFAMCLHVIPMHLFIVI